MKIQNISKRKQAIVGVPEFSPLEIREVSKETAEKLLSNPNFSEVKTRKVETPVVSDETEAPKSVNYKKDKIK